MVLEYGIFPGEISTHICAWASVYRRKSLPARDAGFTVEDICMLSESWAPADFLYASFWVWTTEGLFVLESSVPGRMA